MLAAVDCGIPREGALGVPGASPATLKRWFQALPAAIGRALDAIAPDDAKEWFAHYDRALRGQLP